MYELKSICEPIVGKIQQQQHDDGAAIDFEIVELE